MREELARNGAMMTQYERYTIENDIKNTVERIYLTVATAVLNDHNAALTKLQQAKDAYKKEQGTEIDRWEPDKLTSALNLAHQRVNMAISAENSGAVFGTGPTRKERVQQLMDEARQSENPYTKRAIYEVIGSLPLQDGTDRMGINHLSKEAQRALPKLSQTEGLKKAEQDEEAAHEEYRAVRMEVQKAFVILGQGNPVGPLASGPAASALQRFQYDEKTGEYAILTPNEVEELHTGSKLRNYVAGEPIPGEEG